MAASKMPRFLVAMVIIAVLAVMYLPPADAEVEIANSYIASNEQVGIALQRLILLAVAGSFWKLLRGRR